MLNSKILNPKTRKFLDNAYKVHKGESLSETISHISEEVMKETGLPRDIVVTTAFFEKMKLRHPEIKDSMLFEFIETLNIPDEIYQMSDKNKLNFFRDLEDFTNIVATSMKHNQQVVTSILTSSKNYPKNIKKTARAVFSKTGRTSTPPSVMLSPSARKIISDVSSKPDNNKKR